MSNEKDFIFNLKDGGVLDIKSDRETCGDDDKLFTCEYSIVLTKLSIHFKTSEVNECKLTESCMMRLILDNICDIINMTELNFANWLEKKIMQYTNNKDIFDRYEISKEVI